MRTLKARAYYLLDSEKAVHSKAYAEWSPENQRCSLGYVLSSDDYAVVFWTGLKDKNGVEIYEGDIVDDHYFENHVSRHKVYWADSYGCWSTLGLKDPIVDRKQLAYFNETKNLHRNEYLEVIGNIYENPELLDEE